jgi:hypothetical protein
MIYKKWPVAEAYLCIVQLIKRGLPGAEQAATLRPVSLVEMISKGDPAR